MSAILSAVLSAMYPSEQRAWVDPFLQATRRMNILEKRQKDGTHVTAETKAERAAINKTPTTNDKPKRKGKSKGKKSKLSKEIVDEPEDGLGDDIEDQVMAKAAEDLLKLVSRGISYRR